MILTRTGPRRVSPTLIASGSAAEHFTTMLPTSSELRRRSTPQRIGSSSSKSKSIIVNNKDLSSTTLPLQWSSLQQHDSTSSARPLPASASSSTRHQPSFLSVNSLISPRYRPRIQALLCLCLTVLPWIYHSSQNHKLRSVHTALSKLLREHKQLLAGLEHTQRELERAERAVREVELDNKELVDLLAEAAASAHGSETAYATMQQQQEHTDEGSIDVDSNGQSVNMDADDAAGSGTGQGGSTMYREAQHLEDLYLERIGIIEAAITNHSMHHLRNAYLPSQASDKDGPLYVEIRLVAEEEEGGKDRSAPEIMVLETAPIRVAPHAIDHFLRLVESNYYGGRAFALLHQPTMLPASMLAKAGGGTAKSTSSSYMHRIHTIERKIQQHLLHDAAVTTDNNKAKRAEELKDNRLTSMAFREHRHGTYPVQKYSVLFHGKPGGGPHFSIHMMDRPIQRRGEDAGDEDEEGDEIDEDWDQDDDDACFGRIVRGQEILDRLVEASRTTKRQQRVVIDSISLLAGAGW